MNVIAIIALVFAFVGAIDKLLGNKFGIAKEFVRGFELFAVMAFSMLGMLVIAPAIAVWLSPFFEWFYNVFGIDPSILPSSLFANDMGGTAISLEICKSQEIGLYNAFVISSMMGCVISFMLPVSMSLVKKENHNELFFGVLCGIVTIPIGCFVAGLVCKLPIIDLLINLLPLGILSVILMLALIFFRRICIKVFSIFGFFMETIALIGLLCGMFTKLTGIVICKDFGTLDEAAMVCVNACVILAGALPFVYIFSKLLKKPLNKLGSKIGIDELATASLLSTIVTSTPTISVMNQMNKKGIALNAAFAVSAGFALGGHLAFTMAQGADYVVPMIIGKLVSGVCGLLLALLLYKEKTEA